MKLTAKLIYIFLIIFLIGCSSGKKLTDNLIIVGDKKGFQIPAGVDSSIARNSKMKAERLFVDTKSEQIADSLNKYFSDYLKTTIDLYTILENKRIGDE